MRAIAKFFKGSTSATTILPEVEAFTVMSLDRTLSRITKRGIEVRTVIDIGASDGRWTAQCAVHFPSAEYLLIEALNAHYPALDAFCAARSKVSYVKAAASDQVGTISFYDDGDPFGGAALKGTVGKNIIRVPATTVDHEVTTRGLKGPFYLKLDTHGFEVPILEGAKETLRECALVQIEVYNFRLRSDALMMDEMIAYMRKQGMGMIDISEPLWRDYDKALWQLDAFFVPLTDKTFSHSGYR